MTSVRVVALDFDGVLVDSNEAKRLAYDDVFGAFPSDQPALARLRQTAPALNRVEFFTRALSEIWHGRPDAPTLEQCLSALGHAMVARVSACPEVAGSQRLWAQWPGATMAIVSLTPQADLRPIVERRGYVIAPELVFGCPPWSKVAALRALLERECATPHELLVVGDSRSDERAAVEVGARFLRAGLPNMEWSVA